MLTNRLENDNAFGPPSHGVGPCSEGWLKSWLKSALQSTRSTADCPALRRYPRFFFGGVAGFGLRGSQTNIRFSFVEILISSNGVEGLASRSTPPAPSFPVSEGKS